MSVQSNHRRDSKETQVDRILRKIGLEAAPRNPRTMQLLSEAIEHPSQVAESPFLGDEDPLKLTAIDIMDQFEGATNGMRESKCSDTYPSETDPFLPWRYLIDAIRAFYDNDFHSMSRALRRIPAGTAPEGLIDIFDELAGKPPANGIHDSLAGRLLTKNQVLTDGIGVLEEAAAYPNLLRREMARFLPELTKENRESARRLAVWALESLAEDGILTNEDETAAAALGRSEAARFCALASLPYDPDRSLIAWLRSLNYRLLEGDTTPAEAAARLSIAAEMLQIAKSEGCAGFELISGAEAVLTASYPMLKSLIPSLFSRDRISSGLYEWLISASRPTSESTPPNLIQTPRRKRRQRFDGELTLFGEVSS